MSQPYDKESKLYFEEESRLVLYTLTGLPLDEPAHVECLDREINIGARRADHVFKVTRRGQTIIEHLEATTEFKNLRFKDVYERSVLLEMKHGIGVRTRNVIMTDRGMPESPPERIETYLGGSNRLIHTVEYVRVWKRPARLALEAGDRGMMPWVALMDASAEEQAEVVRRLKPDRDLMGRYRNLLALRYRGKEELLERIALMNSFWTDEIMAESWLVQEELRAREEGSRQGRQEGSAQEARRMLRRVLDVKFQAIPGWADSRIDSASVADLEDWTCRCITAESVEEALS